MTADIVTKPNVSKLDSKTDFGTKPDEDTT